MNHIKLKQLIDRLKETSNFGRTAKFVHKKPREISFNTVLEVFVQGKAV